MGAALFAPLALAGPSGSYMRIVDVDDDTMRLDMAVRLFVPKDGQGPTIALAAAIHVADPSFYDAAQLYLDAQDLVLFEGVGMRHQVAQTPAEKAAKTKSDMRYVAVMLERYKLLMAEYPPSLDALTAKVGEFTRVKQARLKRAAVDEWGRKLRYERDNGAYLLTSLGADRRAGGEGADADIAFADLPPLTRAEIEDRGGIQNSIAEALGLTFQLNAFDTGGPNYRNSDLSIAALNERIAAEGGDLRVVTGMMDGTTFAARFITGALRIIRANPKLQTGVKVVLMETLREVGDDLTKMRGVPRNLQSLMKVLLHDRNQKVVDDLKAELAKGDAKKGGAGRTIAVWYGAGHMMDLETRLTEQLSYRHAGGFWLPAMTIRLDEAGVTRSEVQVMRALVKQALKLQ